MVRIGRLVLACSVALVGATQSTPPGPRRPNILLIVADDVGAEASRSALAAELASPEASAVRGCFE
jgi:hypothetical protein